MTNYSAETAVSKTARGLRNGRVYTFTDGNGHTHAVGAGIGPAIRGIALNGGGAADHFVVFHGDFSETFTSATDAAREFVDSVGGNPTPSKDGGCCRVIRCHDGTIYRCATRCAA